MKKKEIATGASILQVRGVSLTLGGNLILRDVNAEIRDIRRPGLVTGQVVALLGPSGIGKTRLFRILAGLDPPDTGEVLVGDPGEPVRRGTVGVVAQSYPLFAHRTVLGNLMVAGRSAGLGAGVAREKSLEFLKRFGLEDRGDHYPAQLSGGQRQRVAIAQQFLCSENLLLLDEPFSGLDPIAVDRVCALVQEVAHIDEMNTIVVVTHDIAAAIEVADTLWIMGRDRDERGAVVPGAKIADRIDLVARGLAWRDGITTSAEFLDTLREVRARFPSL